MNDVVLSLRQLRKSFGPTEIVRGVDLDLLRGERHAVIGPNGAGKSTLFHLISGRLAPTAGEILLDGRPIHGAPPERICRLGLGRSFQITDIFAGLSVFENLRLAVLRRFGLAYCWWRAIDRHRAVSEETLRLLEQMRLTAQRDVRAGELSYSAQRSLEIGITLAGDPQVILLDEPMAGMSLEETRFTMDLIREVTRGRTLLVVEHDMDVVFALSDRISVLVHGERIATGTPAQIREDVRVREAYLGEPGTA